MKDLKYGLDIQYFAEGAGEEAGAQESQSQPEKAPEIDYSKIEEIINKRSSSKENSVLVGYLKEQGLTGDELTQAINAYKDKKEQDKKTAQQEQDNMRIENQQLKAQILNSNIDSKLTSLAAEEGVQAEKIPFLLKLVDRNGIANEKGEIDEAKAKSSLEAVLKAFPDFKVASQNNNGFQQIGSSSENNNNSIDDKLDAIFGIKKK